MVRVWRKRARRDIRRLRKFKIWEDGEIIYQTSGKDVLKAISKEMYRNQDLPKKL